MAGGWREHIGEDYQRAGEIKNAIEIFQLNLLGLC
jgi:hypothetical protein